MFRCAHRFVTKFFPDFRPKNESWISCAVTLWVFSLRAQKVTALSCWRCNSQLVIYKICQDRSLWTLCLRCIKPYIYIYKYIYYIYIYKPPFHIFGGWYHFSCFQVSLVWQQKSIIFLVLEVMVNLLRCKTYRAELASNITYR